MERGWGGACGRNASGSNATRSVVPIKVEDHPDPGQVFAFHRRFPSIHVEASVGRGGWGWNVLCERIPARIGISEENIAPDGELGLSKNREQYSTADGGDLTHNRLPCKVGRFASGIGCDKPVARM